MKKRKTMELWQMLVLLVICLGLLLDMFLPLWNINGTKIVDWYMDTSYEIIEQDVEFPWVDESVLKSIVQYKGNGKQEKLEKLAEDIDDGIEKIEESSGINICSLSGIDYLTMDVNALFLADKDYTEADLEKFEKSLDTEQLDTINESKHKIMNVKRTISVMFYTKCVLLIFILLGFFLRWDKRIVSILSILQGLGAMGTWAAEWWATPWVILNGVEDKELAEQLLPVIKSLWSSVVGMGIKVGFVLGILLLVMGIVTCIVGKREIEIIDDFNNNIYDRNNDFQRNIWDNQNQATVFEHNNINRNWHENEEADVVLKPPKPKAGQVKCTQGVAMGQGFKLPEDRKVIVGKSPQNATLVIHDQHVSNVHCSIRYRAETNSYIVKDHSTNGTFVQGVRLAKEIAMEYPPGTVLSLADGSNKITLG